jgi:hypothetical protein
VYFHLSFPHFFLVHRDFIATPVLLIGKILFIFSCSMCTVFRLDQLCVLLYLNCSCEIEWQDHKSQGLFVLFSLSGVFIFRSIL